MTRPGYMGKAPEIAAVDFFLLNGVMVYAFLFLYIIDTLLRILTGLYLMMYNNCFSFLTSSIPLCTNDSVA